MNKSDGKKHKSSKSAKAESGGGKKRKGDHHHSSSSSSSKEKKKSSSSSSSASLKKTIKKEPKSSSPPPSSNSFTSSPVPISKKIKSEPSSPPASSSFSSSSSSFSSSAAFAPPPQITYNHDNHGSIKSTPSSSSGSSYTSSPSSSTISNAYNNNIVNNYTKPKLDPFAFGSKVRTRSKVYSGTVRNATYDNVPKLEKLCLQVLMDNYTNITYLGDAPYYLIKPVLEKCTSNQLFILEDYNPRLTEDDDELWKWHCEKEFRNWRRQEDETWRDLFIRAEQERKRKLESITRSIDMKEKSRGPARKTQLAFTDTVPKPPRNVKKLQDKQDKGFVKVTKASIASSSTSNSSGAQSNPGSGGGGQKKTKGLLMKNARVDRWIQIEMKSNMVNRRRRNNKYRGKVFLFIAK